MESNGIAGVVNVSGEVYRRLLGDFTLEPGGAVDLKGKGRTEVYFLRQRRVSTLGV